MEWLKWNSLATILINIAYSPRWELLEDETFIGLLHSKIFFAELTFFVHCATIYKRWSGMHSSEAVPAMFCSIFLLKMLRILKGLQVKASFLSKIWTTHFRYFHFIVDERVYLLLWYVMWCINLILILEKFL